MQQNTKNISADEFQSRQADRLSVEYHALGRAIPSHKVKVTMQSTVTSFESAQPNINPVQCANKK